MMLRLRRNGHADARDLLSELIGGEVGAEARYALEFVDRAARVAQRCAPTSSPLAPPAPPPAEPPPAWSCPPRPPVECLSTLRPGIEERSSVSPELAITCVSAVASAWSIPRSTTAINSAAICASLTTRLQQSPYHPRDFIRAQRRAVPFLGDDLGRGHGERVTCPRASSPRCARPRLALIPPAALFHRRYRSSRPSALARPAASGPYIFAAAAITASTTNRIAHVRKAFCRMRCCTSF